MTYSKRKVKMLTICCKDVQNTATHAQSKPLFFISTSVTVQIPTPTATAVTAIITLDE